MSAPLEGQSPSEERVESWGNRGMTLGTMGHSRIGHSPFILGDPAWSFPKRFPPRPGHIIMTICPSLSLLLSPNSCLGPQLTPSPCPRPPSPAPIPLV